MVFGYEQKKSRVVGIRVLSDPGRVRYREPEDTPIPSEDTMSEPVETPTKDPEQQVLVPPYFAFKTLTNQLDFMKEKGVPARIDRSFLLGMSGAGQAQYITGLRSLGLIDANGTVSERLIQMVNGSAVDRKRLLREILHERYAKAIELGKQNATTGQLVELFREEYGATGDTARKGIAFYLNAARYAGDVPLSPMFQTPKVTSSGGTRRRRTREAVNGGGPETPETPQSPPAAGTEIPMPAFHPTLAGVLMEFPTRGQGWTKERRDKTMQMFQFAVDFTIPIVDVEPTDEGDLEED